MVGMEIDGDPLSKSSYSMEGKGVQEKHGDVQALQMGKGQDKGDKDELTQNSIYTPNNKKQSMFKRLERTNQDIFKEVESGLDRKRSYEDGANQNEVIKRQRLEVMWRDDEGNVVEVETDSLLEAAGMPQQLRLTK
jgi:cell shape-determining protein MreC